MNNKMGGVGASIYLGILILFINSGSAQISSNKLCTDNFNRDACQQIERDNEIACGLVTSQTDCILDADKGLPTLSVLKPEEAFLGASLVTGQAVVIGEIDVQNHPPFQTAVIVRSNYLGGFESIRGLKYCHPGYDHDELTTTYVLEELDWKAIPSLSCDANKTLTEQKFQALSVLFGSSCRPGKWTSDEALDIKLKSEYSSLCDLCGTDRCNTKYTVPFNDTLKCLTENGGDIAITTLSYASAFFSIGRYAQDYRYLCPNGSLASSTNPCTWTNQLKRVIISSSDSAATMKNYLDTKVPSYVNGSTSSSSTVEASLARLLGLARTDTINLVNPLALSSYVLERRHVPTLSESTKCERVIKWSVTDQRELAKCNWLQQASLNVGLQPVITCVSSNDNDTVSNLDNIKNGYADVAFAAANFGYIARKKSLTNIAYPETDVRRLSRIVIVVKNDTTWYTQFSDLKGKRACFPEYGGKEWLAFISVFRDRRIFTNSASCDYGQLFSDFVGDSCAPGANSKDLGILHTDQTKLCANCLPVSATTTAKYCNADNENKYYHSFGALTCLEDNNGDYAVIAINDLPEEYLNNIEAQNRLRVISKNGSLASYPGLQVDEESPLTIINAGEIVVKNGTFLYSDILLYLKELEYEFGQNPDKPFKIFERFDHEMDLLFPDSTPGLTFGGTPNKYIENFKALLLNSETCGGSPGSSSRILPAFFSVFVVYFLSRLV